MKASNIILASAVGSITLLIITGALQLRLTGHKKNPPVKVQQEEIALPHFEHLVINDIGNGLMISSGQKRTMNYSFSFGDRKPTIDYHIKGDTLYIEGLQRNSKVATINLIIPQDVQLIQGKNASFQISNYNGKSLNLSLNRTVVSIHGKNHFETLSIKGLNDCNINSFTGQVDTLQINLNNSEATIQNSVIKLRGALHNNSKLAIKEVYDFDFKKDASSKLTHWN